MPRVSYIFDNRAAGDRFLSSLDRTTLKQRFASRNDWRPNHLVLALVDNKAVALADALDCVGGQASVASIVAQPGFGGYAVAALRELQRRVERPYWLATLRTLTPATEAIARRFCDLVYDDGAWAIVNRLVEEHGMQSHLMPTPIIATARLLKLHQLPPISRFDAATRLQVLHAAAKPGRVLLRAPSGDVLTPMAHMVLAFEFAGLRIEDRQNITRLMAVATAAAHGHMGDPAAAKKFSNPEAFSRFMRLVEQSLETPVDGDGLFQEEEQTVDPAAALMRAINTGSLPSNRNRGGSRVLLSNG